MSSTLIENRTPSPQDKVNLHHLHRVPEVRLYPPDATEPVSTSFAEDEDAATAGLNDWNFSSEMASNSWVSLPSNGQAPSSISLMGLTRLQDSATIEDTESWNPFNNRPANLSSFAACQATSRTIYRAQSVLNQRTRSGWITSSTTSLEYLRQILQQSINKELDEILRKYLEKFFAPAVENIRNNRGEASVSEEHVNNVCKQILEEAKRMYTVSHTRGSTPVGDYSDSETGSHSDGRFGLPFSKNVQVRRRKKDSDTDSEASQIMLQPVKKKKGRPPLHGRLTPWKQGKSNEPVKREGPKWEPNRLNKDTLFVMGSRANKSLGFGQTRGRLYIKHPELFKYGGDAEDKQWLYDSNLMPATGGRAYMLILEDIKELAESDEYRNSTGLLLHELIGFTVPENILEKMRSYMQAHRTDIPGRKTKGRPSAHYSGIQPTTSPLMDHTTDGKPPSESLLTDYGGTSPGGSSGSFLMKRTGLESSGPTSPADDLDLAADPSPTQPSPFMLGSGLEVSPTPSELQNTMDNDPPLSAPFDITDC